MDQTMVVQSKHVLQEFHTLSRFDIENIVFYQLSHKVSPLLRRNLKSVYSQTQEYFCKNFFWLGLFVSCFNQFVLVIFQNFVGN